MSDVKVDGQYIIPEDEVTNSMIEAVGRHKCHVEVPYNNYGSRGYVDLVVDEEKAAWICELKSKPSQANEVIRQFNKMKENFIDGKSLELDAEEAAYILIFTASSRNLQHIKDNKEMYFSLEQSASCFVRMRGTEDDGIGYPVFIGGQVTEETLREKYPRLRNKLECPYCGKEYKIESYYREHVKECFE